MLDSLSANIAAPAFEVTVGRRPLDPLTARRITNLSVNSSLNSPSSFTINLNNQGLVFLGGGLTGTVPDLSAEGQRIGISFGYAGKPLKEVIVGEVARLDAEFSSGDAPSLTVTGYDFMHRLTRTSQPQTVEQQTLAALMERIVQGAKLSVKVDPSLQAATPPPHLAHTGQADFHFIEEWIRVSGWTMWMEGETLNIAVNPRLLQPSNPIFEWGKTLISFSTSLSIAGLVNELEVSWHDPETSQHYVSRAKLDGSVLTYLQPPARQRLAATVRYPSGQPRIINQQDAEARAQALLRAMVDDATSANATIVGTPELRPGMKITLRGIGSRFSGEFSVRSVTHSLGAGGYRTTFQGTRVLR